MVKQEKIIMEWTVEKIVGGGMYLVILDGWLQVQAKPKGKLTRMKIKILPGDKVQVQLNEVDPTKGYIIYRL